MEGTTAAATMTSLLTSLGEVGTKVLDFAGQVADQIMAHPLLLLTVGIMFIGGCIGIFGRLLSRN